MDEDRKIVEIWQNLEKNATQNMIFLPRYMWAENNKQFFKCNVHEGPAINEI